MNTLLFIATVLIWGTTFHAITLQLGEVPPLQSVFYRFAMAAVLMWVFVIWRRGRVSYPVSIHGLFALLGLLLFSLNYVVVYHATGYLVSGLVSVIMSMIIVFNTLFYRVFFKERPTPAFIAGSLLGITGLAFLFMDDIYGISLSESVFIGGALTLLSSLFASSGNIIAQLLKLRNIDVVSCNTWGMSYGSLFLLIAVALTGEPWQFSMRTDYILALLYLSLAGTVVAFWFYLTLIHRIGAPRAAYITVSFPLVALLVSTVLEDMHWTIYKLVGIGLILAGNIFIIRRKKITETTVP